MFKEILIFLLMLINYCELNNKNIVYYDYSNEINNQMSAFAAIGRLNSECTRIQNEILTQFKLNFANNICPIDSNNSLETKLKAKPTKIDFLEIFYSNFFQMKSLFDQFEKKYKELKLQKQKMNYRNLYGKNKCNLIDYYKDITAIRQIKSNITEFKNEKSYLIEYYKSLPIEISKNKEENSNEKNSSTGKMIPIYLRRHLKKILLNKNKVKLVIVSKQCNMNNYYKKLILKVAKSIEVSKKFQDENSCYLNDYFKQNNCKLNIYYENIIRNITKSKPKKVEAYNLDKSYLISYYKSLMLKSSSFKSKKRLLKPKISNDKFCKLFDFYKNITSSIAVRKRLKENKIKLSIDLNQSNLLDYYKSIFNNIRINKPKIVRKRLQTLDKYCFINDYYFELIKNVSNSLSLKEINKVIKQINRTDECNVNDLIYHVFLEKINIKSLERVHQFKQAISYDKYVYLFNAKYLKCKKVPKTKNSFKKLVAKECINCTSYRNLLIQLAPKKVNKILEIKCDYQVNNIIQLNLKNEIQLENQTVEKIVPKNIPKPAQCNEKYQIDCYDYYKQGYMKNTVLSVRPNLKPDCNKVKVGCDMKSSGYTLIMRRQYGTLDFKRNWTEYKTGFGDASKDHWIGNDMIYYITNQLNYSLRIELEDWDGNRKYANYDLFRIKSELEGYELFVSGYSGDAGDSLSDHSGKKFSTYDVDNDDAPEWFFDGNCAARFGGGWWYNACYKSNLNGKFYNKGKVPPKLNDGIAWKSWLPSSYSLKLVEMKIRRKFNKKL